MTTQDIIKAINYKIIALQARSEAHRKRRRDLVKYGKLFTIGESSEALEEYLHLSTEDMQLEHIIASLNEAVASLTKLESLNL